MKQKYLSATIWFFLLLVLILDGKTVISGAVDGIEICLFTVIPSLFPFFVITGMLTGSLGGAKIPGTSWISKACKIPQGSESIFLLGTVGGYPMGAKAISDTYRQGKISKNTAHRMLGFCSNCGPSFIFGICTSFFANVMCGWLLWGIQILSAILTGMILPGGNKAFDKQQNFKKTTIDQALKSSLQAIAKVCGWVILFRVFLTVQNRWVLRMLPKFLKTLIIGLQELSNGCIELNTVENVCARFVICSTMLTFGGLCVILQTKSVTEDLGLGLYFPGKCIQTGISTLISLIVSRLYFGERIQCLPFLVIAAASITTGLFLLKRKNSSIFTKSVV